MSKDANFEYDEEDEAIIKIIKVNFLSFNILVK